MSFTAATCDPCWRDAGPRLGAATFVFWKTNASILAGSLFWDARCGRISSSGRIIKENGASFAADSPLRSDAETILGRRLNQQEDENGLELNVLIGKKCQIVVFHKSGSGGRPKPAVSLLLPAKEEAKAEEKVEETKAS